MAYIGNIPAEKYQTLQKQSFTTSATDTYTLSYSVTNPQDLALFINNVRQNPNDAYTVSGTTLTLSSAITSSDTMYAVFLGRAVETVAPATGSVTNAMLAGSIATSKLADGSTFATTNGITEADVYRLDTTFTGDATPINGNLERDHTSGFAKIGTGVTHSSGVFSFPSTGIYLVRGFVRFYLNSSGGSRFNRLIIENTNDNGSNWTVRTDNSSDIYHPSSTAFTNVVGECLVDVTNTSNDKVRFQIQVADNNVSIEGDQNFNATYFTFIRLGDT